VLDLAQNFLRCDGSVSCALQVTSASTSRFRISGYSQYHPRGRTALHLLACFGLTSLLEQLIHKPGSENTTSCSLEDSTGSSPLSLAAAHGHTTVVELLVKEGADINVRNEYYGDALQVASYNGHEHIVKLLLSRGAVVNASCGKFGNALQAAASRGHQQVVKLLLDEGAEVNAQGGQYTNALQAASFAGHEHGCHRLPTRRQ
jgi:ankyrin repeat protein